MDGHPIDAPQDFSRLKAEAGFARRRDRLLPAGQGVEVQSGGRFFLPPPAITLSTRRDCPL